jgi:hypothetical protein
MQRNIEHENEVALLGYLLMKCGEEVNGERVIYVTREEVLMMMPSTMKIVRSDSGDILAIARPR